MIEEGYVGHRESSTNKFVGLSPFKGVAENNTAATYSATATAGAADSPDCLWQSPKGPVRLGCLFYPTTL